MSERDYPGALEFLNKMLAMRSNDAWVRVEMGIAYAQTGQPQQALAYLEPLLAAGYPDERGALHGMLAGVLRKLGREQEAQIAAAEANRLSDLYQQHLKTGLDRKSTRLNSSHTVISYAVFCLKKKISPLIGIGSAGGGAATALGVCEEDPQACEPPPTPPEPPPTTFYRYVTTSQLQNLKEEPV